MMLKKIETPTPDHKQFYSYGFRSQETMYQKSFHQEDTLVDLIKEKTGLFNEHSRLRALTDMQDNTVELQLHYDYTSNQDAFIETLRQFLNSAAGKDLNFNYALKETMKFIAPYPVLTMSRADLDALIIGLKNITAQPLNTQILQGDHKPHDTVILRTKRQ